MVGIQALLLKMLLLFLLGLLVVTVIGAVAVVVSLPFDTDLNMLASIEPTDLKSVAASKLSDDLNRAE